MYLPIQLYKDLVLINNKDNNMGMCPLGGSRWVWCEPLQKKVVKKRKSKKKIGYWKCFFCKETITGKIGDKVRTCPKCGIFVGI